MSGFDVREIPKLLSAGVLSAISWMHNAIQEGFEMFDEKEMVVRYKWDAWTGSGYRLRYDAADRAHSYHVEDCSNHVVMDDYGCVDLDEALLVLNRFFNVDESAERRRISGWLPAQRLQ